MQGVGGRRLKQAVNRAVKLEKETVGRTLKLEETRVQQGLELEKGTKGVGT